MTESGMNTLASLIEDLNPALDRKLAAEPRFYAVRKCDALRAPAIFFHWDDCRFYVNVKENDDPVEYESFAMLADAARYLSPQKAKVQPKKNKVAQTAAAKTAVKKEVKPPTRSDASDTPISHVAALKDPPPGSAKETTPLHQLMVNPSTKRKGLPLQRKAVKKAPPASAKRAVKSVKKAIPTSAKKTLKSLKATTVKGPLKRKKSTAKVAKRPVVETPPLKKSDETWEAKFQLLMEFKAEFGVLTLLSVRRNNYGKYKGLYTWVRTVLLFDSAC
jgi:hypothetical protein